MAAQFIKLIARLWMSARRRLGRPTSETSYLEAVSDTLSEWNSAEDAAAYDNL
jgi:hypothetical protein